MDKNDMFHLASAILDIGNENLSKGFIKLSSILNKRKEDCYIIPNALLDTFYKTVEDYNNEDMNRKFEYFLQKRNLNKYTYKDKDAMEFFSQIIEQDKDNNNKSPNEKKYFNDEKISAYAINKKCSSKKEIISYFNEAFKMFETQHQKLIDSKKDNKYIANILEDFRNSIFQRGDENENYMEEKLKINLKNMFFSKNSPELIEEKFYEYEKNSKIINYTIQLMSIGQGK